MFSKKHPLVVIALSLFMVMSTSGFNWKKIEADVKKSIKKIKPKKERQGLGKQDAARGLKAALDKGANMASSQLSKTDGYFKNEAIKILFPPEFRKAEKTLRKLGMGRTVDKAILSMNRAAEKAATRSYPIFRRAITQMTFSDAMGILFGKQNSATTYLRNKTGGQLHSAFLPIVKESANQVDATKYWDDVARAYNRVPFIKKKVPEDISDYITKKAIHGLFHRVAIEEKMIREKPISRTTDILKRVFGYADSKK